MKFYDCATAPSPRRIRIFLAEKRITLPTVQVDLRNGEHFRPEFRKLNPEATVPVLELDNGACLTDSVAICEYLEALRPEPPLFGVGAEERATITEWQHIVEREGLFAAMDAFRNASPGFQGRALPGEQNYGQIPDLAERGRARIRHLHKRLDARLADRDFIAGPRFSIADITALVAVDFAARLKLPPSEGHRALRRWHDAVSARPNARA